MIVNYLHFINWRSSVLWYCWLGGRKSIRPVKTEWSGTGVVICLERCADLHMAQPMPLPLTVSCFSKIQIGFSFLVPAHLGSPRQRVVKWVCVCVCVCVCVINWRSAPRWYLIMDSRPCYTYLSTGNFSSLVQRFMRIMELVLHLVC